MRADTKDEPRFITRPITQIAAVGADIILDCMVNGTRPITMEWQKDGQRLSSDDRILIERYPSGVESVIIERVELTDSGRYSCYAFNSFGTAEYEVEIFVTSKVSYIWAAYIVQMIYILGSIVQCFWTWCVAAVKQCPFVYFKCRSHFKHNPPKHRGLGSCVVQSFVLCV